MDAVKKAARPFVRDCLNRRMNRRGRFWHSQTVARILIRLGREVDSEINALRARVQRYEERLEITHHYRMVEGDGVELEFEPVEIPYAERPTAIDGIECRDASIMMLEEVLEEVRAERDAYRATLMDIAAVKHPDAVRSPHQEMARECVRKWEAGK